jgi:tRNA pseudouridine32 synthase/23S rRNA pseudouridine746 synthase
MQDGKSPVEAVASPPAHMLEALAGCGWGGEPQP